MAKDKCGIYKIQCGPTGKAYVGSSVQIYVRFAQHRRALRAGKHFAPVLQRAWNKHGERAFYFVILEECSSSVLAEREQHYINLLCPKFNTLLNIDRGLVELARARAALITHCPKGHAYDEANTMINQGKRVCRKCNAERVAATYASETPEETRERLDKGLIRYRDNLDKRRATAKKYNDARKPEKAEYDRERRERIAGRPMRIPAAKQSHCAEGHAYEPDNYYVSKNGQRRCRVCVLAQQNRKRCSESPEEREARLAGRRQREREPNRLRRAN